MKENKKNEITNKKHPTTSNKDRSPENHAIYSKELSYQDINGQVQFLSEQKELQSQITKPSTSSSQSHSLDHAAKQKLQGYINSIDFSMVLDASTVSNIYQEIGSNGPFLATNPYAISNMEKLVSLSDSALLIDFIDHFTNKICFTKLGSRFLECVLRRLFECMYLHKESFLLERIISKVHPQKCIASRDGSHVLREAIMLLTGKKVRKLAVEKYTLSGNSEISEQNRAYAASRIEEYKQAFVKHLRIRGEAIEMDDTWGTIAVFVQCTKSQSFIKALIEKDLSVKNIQSRSYFYETLPSLSNTANLSSIYEIIKGHVMQLTTDERSSYFMREFARHFHKPWKLFRRFVFNNVEQNSNVVVALLEALIKARRYEEIQMIVKGFYSCEDDLLHEMLLKKYEGIDTKYVAVVVGLMGLPEAENYNVNKDFVKYFTKEWTYSKGGIKLVEGYANGSETLQEKQKFFSETIDMFWNCTTWREGKSFAKLLTKYTTFHARKKAFEMLHRIESL